MPEQPKWITPYEHAAYLADEAVREVLVSSPAPNVVRVVVRAWTGGGVPDDTVLNKVRSAIQSVSVLTHQVSVEAIHADRLCYASRI